ncbi:MAG: hypothetical protein QOH88_854 [Verrucomicrobiota bacterium]|jgi:hypothetical protein
MTSSIIKFLSTAAFVVGFSTLANAQATRTWVSGVGDDVNPCSRTAPCKTFAGAISKTATGGEISVLDPGGFGTLTITKSITVNGDGTLAGVLSASAPQAFLVNITTNLTTDKVVIRNVSINGAGTGTDGVRIIDGTEVILDNVTISGLTDAGVDCAQSQSSSLFLHDVRISKAFVGVRTQSTVGTVAGAFRNVAINGMTSHGVECVNNTSMVIRNLETTKNGGSGVRSSGAGVDVSVLDSTASGNNIGFDGAAGIIRITNCGMFYNNTNLAGSVATGGNNKSASNTTQNVPIANGMVTN